MAYSSYSTDPYKKKKDMDPKMELDYTPRANPSQLTQINTGANAAPLTQVEAGPKYLKSAQTGVTQNYSDGNRVENPFYDIRDIVTDKGNFHTQKELGGDPEYWRNHASQYYDNLRKNGFGDIADELMAADYTKAQDILSRYKPDEVNQMEKTTNDFLSSLEDIGTGKTNPGNPELEKYIKSFAEQPTRVSDSTQKILDSWNANDALYGNLTKDHYNTGKQQLDYLNNFDITSQPYYDSIMAQYNLFGGNAAKGEQAAGAAGNSGNIDSYAQAAANRQQLAFTTAGQEAARAEAQRLQGNWQTLYDAMSGNVNQFGATNAQNLARAAQMYDTDAGVQKNALDNLVGMYDIQSGERQNAVSNATNYRIQEELNKTNKEIEEIRAVKDNYAVDSQERQTLAQIEADKVMKAQELANDLAISKIDADARLGAAGIDAEASKYGADRDYAAKVYGYDMDKAINDAKIAADKKADSSVATENAADEYALSVDDYPSVIMQMFTNNDPSLAGITSYQDLVDLVAQDAGISTQDAGKILNNSNYVKRSDWEKLIENYQTRNASTGSAPVSNDSVEARKRAKANAAYTNR